MYNWRIRNNDQFAKQFYLNLRNYYVSKGEVLTYNIPIYSSTTFASLTMFYVDADSGDDVNGDGSMENPVASLYRFFTLAQSAQKNYAVVLKGDFSNESFTCPFTTGLLEFFCADTFGAAKLPNKIYNKQNHFCYSGCYCSATSSDATPLRSSTFQNSIIDLSGLTYGESLKANESAVALHNVFYNGSVYFPIRYTTTTNNSHIYHNCIFINCIVKIYEDGFGAWYGLRNCLFVNCNFESQSQSSGFATKFFTAWTYNCVFDENIKNVEALKNAFVDVSDKYESISDFCVDPSHMNYDIRRDVLDDEFDDGTKVWKDYLGVTGDAIKFNQVICEDVQNVSLVNGIYSIDDTKPGKGHLVTNIMSNRGKVANTFVGFSTKMIHVKANNIQLGSFEKYDMDNVTTVSAGATGTITPTANTLYLVNNACQIGLPDEEEDIDQWDMLFLEAGNTYNVIADTEDVKVVPFKYNSINNYFGIRFKNDFDTTPVKAGVTLENDCSYYNKTSAAITVTEGTKETEVEAGGTYIPTTDTATADGVLTKVFDKDDVYNQLNTCQFQTNYKAGKFHPDLVDYNGNRIPLTDAFGECHDGSVTELDSLNYQFDYMQVRIDYKVYDF